jgi:hypothetical protein
MSAASKCCVIGAARGAKERWGQQKDKLPLKPVVAGQKRPDMSGAEMASSRSPLVVVFVVVHYG